MKRLLLFFLLLCCCATGYAHETMDGDTDLATLVYPLTGTGGHGHTHPGALVPFGMVQPGPDTRLDGWDGCSGYHYSDTVVYGFSHTHLSGTGCSDYGDILLMPAVSDTGLDRYGYASPFSHSDEIAEAGYYKTTLSKPNIGVELTASARVGMHRYQFNGAGENKWVILNLRHRDEVLGAGFHQVDSFTLRGYRFSKAWAQNQRVYFEVKFSWPVAAVKHGADSLVTAFRLRAGGKPLLVKVALSAVDEQGAHHNMETEMPGWDFQACKRQAHEAWQRELSRIVVKGGQGYQQVNFYTALYHVMSAPNLYSDADNRYRGRDDKIHSTEGKFDYYTVFSLWDTYRAEHPLLALIDPKRTSDFINTFIAQYEQGGALPVWELSANETYCMIGYHAVPVIWDAYNRGIRGFDAEKAYKAMRHSAMQDRFGLASYKKYGYVRSDDEGESVSKTLEYAYDDWCIAKMANALGKMDDHAYFGNRSQNWKNVFDPTTGFMRARRNGTLSEGFSPYAIDGNFTEANSWQYSFYVPQDINGLIEAQGGKAAFEARLDSLFNARPQTEGREQPDVTGLIGQYAHGNEPSHHIAYLYNYVGKPEKTKALVKRILDSFYYRGPEGIIGNEDCGQMSAWYVLSAMGFYPVCPGMTMYNAGQPLFDTVYISLNGAAKQQLLLETWTSRNEVGIPRSEDYIPEYDMGHIDPIVPNPYIVSGARIFRRHQQIAIDCIDKRAQIRYSLNGDTAMPYTGPITLKGNTEVRFYAQRDREKSYVQEARFTRLPDDRSVALHSTYNKSYSAGGPDALIDGLHGNTNWRTGGWQGYQGQDFEAVVALKGRARKVSTVRASFLEDQNAWIFYPASVSFYASDDSVHWQHIETVSTNKPPHVPDVTTSVFSTQRAVKASYIKVVAKSFGKMPDWHEGRGEPTFLFVDEIEVK